MNRRRASRHGGGRPALLVYGVCAVYLYCLGALVAWAALPAVTGLTPTLIVSGSMAPAINAGDLVLIGSLGGRPVDTGSVVTFDDPTHAGRLLTHRIATVNADGTYRTRGDANPKQDSTSIPASRIRGVGRVLVPAVGLPLVWLKANAWLQLGLWLAGTVVALGYLRVQARWLPSLSHWSTRLDAPTRPAPRTPRHRRPRPVGLPRLRGSVALFAVAVVAAAALPQPEESQASFTAPTANPDNNWGAASSLCNEGTQTLHPVADARVTDTITTPAGTATTLGVKNKNSVERSLLDFDLPGVGGCTVAATLRLHVSSGQTGQTLRARGAAAAWTESTVIWSSQPGLTGPSADTPSAGGGSWVQFDVSAFVDELRTGTLHGFVVHDASEGAGGPARAHVFSSREAASNKPELVLNLTGTPMPAAPSALSAAAETSTRIGLSWTDNTGGSGDFRIERSAGGADTWTIVGTVAAGTTSYVDTNLDPSTTYDYRVRATGSGGVSTPSNVASATTPAAPSPPEAPTGLSATATGVGTVALAWTDVATNEDGYTIQRSPAGAATWTDVTTTGPGATSHTDTALQASTAYDYRVRAYNGGGTSAWSSTVRATTHGCATLPADTLTPVADNSVISGGYADTNFGTDPAIFYIYSLSGTNGRALVRFPAPALPGGCAVTSATLRLYVAAPTAGRTLEAYKVAAAWGETTSTWNNQPVTTGAPVTTASPPAAGWISWDVTSLLTGAGTGLPDGVLLRDSVEDAATAQSQQMSPREGTNPPQLVVRFD